MSGVEQFLGLLGEQVRRRREVRTNSEGVRICVPKSYALHSARICWICWGLPGAGQAAVGQVAASVPGNRLVALLVRLPLSLKNLTCGSYSFIGPAL